MTTIFSSPDAAGPPGPVRPVDASTPLRRAVVPRWALIVYAIVTLVHAVATLW